ncbi:MAG: GntR family transcriptional regulator [Tissierellia bacterium]|nr:GntR family transcriptional regulator [Tissierellia bacterium]
MNTLLEKIAEGEYPDGAKLPSERELSEEYNISRMTARSAVTQIVNKGYAIRKKGKGTFVVYPRIQRDFTKLSGFSEMLKDKNIEPSNKVISVNVIEASRQIGKLLDISIGTTVFEIVRVRYGDQVPLALEYSYLREDLFPGLLNYDFEKNSLYHIIENEYGFKLKFSKQWIKLTLLRDDESDLLEVNKSSPAFLLESISFDEKNRAVEATKSLNLGDRSVFYTELWPET